MKILLLEEPVVRFIRFRQHGIVRFRVNTVWAQACSQNRPRPHCFCLWRWSCHLLSSCPLGGLALHLNCRSLAFVYHARIVLSKRHVRMMNLFIGLFTDNMSHLRHALLVEAERISMLEGFSSLSTPLKWQMWTLNTKTQVSDTTVPR